MEFRSLQGASGAEYATHPGAFPGDDYNPRPVGALHILDFVARFGKFVKEFHSKLLNWREFIKSIHPAKMPPVVDTLRALAFHRDASVRAEIEVKGFEAVNIPHELLPLPNPFAEVGNRLAPFAGRVAPVFAKDAGFAFVCFEIEVFHIGWFIQ